MSCMCCPREECMYPTAGYDCWQCVYVRSFDIPIRTCEVHSDAWKNLNGSAKLLKCFEYKQYARLSFQYIPIVLPFISQFIDDFILMKTFYNQQKHIIYIGKPS